MQKQIMAISKISTLQWKQMILANAVVEEVAFTYNILK